MRAIASQIFSGLGIKTITGASGYPDSVIKKYLKGELKSTNQ
jgi:predicted Fe-Mo cluster-binding NifX family protein